MRILALASLAMLAIGVSACAMGDKPMADKPAAAPQTWAELVVDDQRMRAGTVTIKHIELSNDGFVVIHESDAEGKPVAPGNIGYTAVKKGDADNVRVRLTKPVKRGAKLFAMLHNDTGKMGTYEFGPGATAEDKPTMMNNAPVMKAFTLR